MADRKHELGHEQVGRLLLRYSAPAIVGMMVNSTYNLVDAIFVGRGVGALALAGLAVSFPIQGVTGSALPSSAAFARYSSSPVSMAISAAASSISSVQLSSS